MGNSGAMKLFFCAICVCFAFTPLSGVSAQEPTVAPLELSASGEAYLDALGYRRIETDVVYYDPSAPAPALETSQQPRPETTDGAGVDISWTERWMFIAVSAAALAAIGYLFVRFGGRASISLRAQVSNPHRNRGAATQLAEAQARLPGNLRQVLDMPDRAAALILLAQTALAKTASFNGLLVQQSWTRRDALRNLPDDQKHLPALRSLVIASERVQFGGRPVSEDEFEHHVQEIKPLLQEVWA